MWRSVVERHIHHAIEKCWSGLSGGACQLTVPSHLCLLFRLPGWLRMFSLPANNNEAKHFCKRNTKMLTQMLYIVPELRAQGQKEIKLFWKHSLLTQILVELQGSTDCLRCYHTQMNHDFWTGLDNLQHTNMFTQVQIHLKAFYSHRRVFWRFLFT